jgi:hypothetical protein
LARLSSSVHRKAEGLLRTYGGLEEFSKNPPWLINQVLKTWFTEKERREIVEFLLRDFRKEARIPILREMGMK